MLYALDKGSYKRPKRCANQKGDSPLLTQASQCVRWTIDDKRNKYSYLHTPIWGFAAIGWFRREIFAVENFAPFCYSVYYVNISRLLFSQLEVTAKISVLSNSPTCALKKTHGGQGDGGVWKARKYFRRYHVYSTIWMAALREGFTMLAVCHVL